MKPNCEPCEYWVKSSMVWPSNSDGVNSVISSVTIIRLLESATVIGNVITLDVKVCVPRVVSA